VLLQLLRPFGQIRAARRRRKQDARRVAVDADDSHDLGLSIAFLPVLLFGRVQPFADEVAPAEGRDPYLAREAP
jgi:hypothetical protein